MQQVVHMSPANIDTDQHEHNNQQADDEADNPLSGPINPRHILLNTGIPGIPKHAML